MKNGKKAVVSVVLIVTMIFLNINFSTSISMAATKSPSIQIASKDLNLKVGDKKKVVLTASTPTILKQSKFTFKSSKKEVVKVSKTGEVTGVSEGKSKITVEAKYKNQTLKASCYVNVTELKSIEISSGNIKKGVFNLKNDTFSSITIKKDVCSSKIDLSQVIVKDTIFIEDGASSRLSLSASNINNIEVVSPSNQKSSSAGREDKPISTITLSKNSTVNQCNLKRDASISLNDKSTMKKLNVSPNENSNLSLSLKGFKSNMVLNGGSNSNITAILNSCNIKQVDIASNNGSLAVDFKNKEYSDSKSTIDKLQFDESVNLKLGVSTNLVTVKPTEKLTASSVDSSTAVQKTSLDIYGSAVIKKIVNDIEEFFVTLANGTVNEFTTNCNKTNILLKTKNSAIDQITVNGNDAIIAGIGSITYVKLNGNNSTVEVLYTKVEAGSETSGNRAGTIFLKENESFIMTGGDSSNSEDSNSEDSNSAGGSGNPSNTPTPSASPNPSNQLDTPSGFIVSKDSDFNYVISWDPVVSALKYSISICEASSGREEVGSVISYNQFTTTLSGVGVKYEIKVKAIGDGNQLLDSAEGRVTFTAGDLLTPTVDIIGCELEDITSKTIDDVIINPDMHYKLSLNLKWNTIGILDSYRVVVKNTSSGTEESVLLDNTGNTLRLNQYITQPNTKYDIIVIPISGGVEGVGSKAYSYTSPSSACPDSSCGDTSTGGFIWKVDNQSGKPVYAITTPEQMEHIKKHFNHIDDPHASAVFMQLNDIDFTGKVFQDNIAGDLRMGGFLYDGQGFMADNFQIEVSSGLGGVFGSVGLGGGAVIKDFGVGKQASIVSTGSTDKVGSIAGDLYGKLYRCYSYAAVAADSSGSIGGLTGQNSFAAKNCYFAGSVINNGNGPTGGITGSMNDRISYSYNIGAVTGGGLTGGIAGIVNNGGGPEGRINACYNLPYPNGPSGSTGGLAGKSDVPLISSLMVLTNPSDLLTGNSQDGSSSKQISLADFQNPQVMNLLDKKYYIYNSGNLRPELIENRERF